MRILRREPPINAILIPDISKERGYAMTRAVLIMCLLSLVCAAAHAYTEKGWVKRDRVFPVTPAPKLSADLANLVDNEYSDTEFRFALTVLQGLVAREGGQIYIYQPTSWHSPEHLPMWVANLEKKGYRFTPAEDPAALFKKYSRFYRGAVLYDDDLGSDPVHYYKLNALTLYCAENSLIPVSPALNSRLGLEVAEDTRGKYLTAASAMQWVREKMWDKACKTALCHIHPLHMALRDYLVLHRILPIWIGAEMTPEEKDMCYDFIDETEANSPVMGCWGGYGEQPAGWLNEPNLQRVCSQKGKYFIVTAGAPNLSFHAGLEFHKPDKPLNSPRQLTLDPSKVYICFNISDGDNIQYVETALPGERWWQNPMRGRVPMGWTLNPVASELIPDVVEYYLETATPSDGFICFPGIGLITPPLYGRDLYGDSEKLLDEYIRLSGKYMKKLGMTTVQFGDTSSVPLTRGDFDRWARVLPWLTGILGDYGPAIGIARSEAAYFVSRGVPVARAVYTSPAPTAEGADMSKLQAELIRQQTPLMRPAFIHAAVINWYGSPETILKCVRALGDDYVPVTPDELFDLMKQARKLGLLE